MNVKDVDGGITESEKAVCLRKMLVLPYEVATRDEMFGGLVVLKRARRAAESREPPRELKSWDE